MKISESQLKKIIGENAKTHIREFIESGGFSAFEANDDEKDRNTRQETKPLHNPNGVSDQNNETKEQQEKRAQVESYFKKDGVDIAPYAYKLYGVEHSSGNDTNEMKNARSKFMKCLNHEPNTNGYPYSFASDEINSLQSYISAGQLSENKRVINEKMIEEAVRSAMKKILG